MLPALEVIYCCFPCLYLLGQLVLKTTTHFRKFWRGNTKNSFFTRFCNNCIINNMNPSIIVKTLKEFWFNLNPKDFHCNYIKECITIPINAYRTVLELAQGLAMHEKICRKCLDYFCVFRCCTLFIHSYIPIFIYSYDNAVEWSNLLHINLCLGNRRSGNRSELPD